MQNLFQFIMLHVFGNWWVLHDLKKGYEATLFMNEVEVAMIKDRRDSLVRDRDALLANMKEHEAIDMSEEAIKAKMPEEDRDNAKAFYDFAKIARGEHAEQVTTFKNRIKSTEDDIQKEEGELQKGYSITYKNRVKYDFISNYKSRKSYANKK